MTLGAWGSRLPAPTGGSWFVPSGAQELGPEAERGGRLRGGRLCQLTRRSGSF